MSRDYAGVETVKNMPTILIVAVIWLCLMLLKSIFGLAGALLIVLMLGFAFSAILMFIIAAAESEQMSRLAHTLVGLLFTDLVVATIVITGDIIRV